MFLIKSIYAIYVESQITLLPTALQDDASTNFRGTPSSTATEDIIQHYTSSTLIQHHPQSRGEVRKAEEVYKKIHSMHKSLRLPLAQMPRTKIESFYDGVG